MEFGNISQGARQYFQSSPLLPHHEAPRQEINPQMTSVRNGPGPGPGEHPYPLQTPYPHTYNPPTDHLHHPNHPNMHYQPSQQQWTHKPVQHPHPPSYYAPPPAQSQPHYRPERFSHVYHPPEAVYYAPPPPEHRLPYAPSSNPPPHSAQVPPELRGVSDPPPARPLPPAPRLPEKREMTRTEFYRQYKQQESLKQRLGGPLPTKPAPQHVLPASAPAAPPPAPQERPPAERFILREENAYWQPPPLTRSVPTWSYTPPAPAPTPSGPSHSSLPAQTRYFAEPPSVLKVEAPLDLSVRSNQPPEPLRRPWGDNGAPPPPRFPYPEPLRPVWPSQTTAYRPPAAPVPFRMPTVDFAPNFSQEVLRYPTPASTAVRAPPVATVSATVRDLATTAPRSISAPQVQPQQRYRDFTVTSNKLNSFPTQFPSNKQPQQRPVGVALVSVKPPPQQQQSSEASEKFTFGGRKAALSPILTQKFRTKAELKQMTPLYNPSKSYVPTTPRLLTADDPLSAWRNACLKRSQDKSETPPDGVKNSEEVNVKLKSRDDVDESAIHPDSDEDKDEMKKTVEVTELKISKLEETSGEKETKTESEEEDAFDRLFSNQCQELESDLALQSFNLKRVKRLDVQKDLSEPSTSGQSLNHVTKPTDEASVRGRESANSEDQYSSEEDVPLSQRTTKTEVQNEAKSPPKKKVQFKSMKQHDPTKRGPLTRSVKRMRLASSEESSAEGEDSDSSAESSSSSSSVTSEEDFTPKTRLHLRSTRSACRVRRSLRTRRRGTSNVIQSDNDDEEHEEPLKGRLRRSELKKKSKLPVKRKRRVLDDAEEEEEKEPKEEKKEEEQKPPVLVKEGENREGQSQEDQTDKNQSKYYPGWEGELLQYKKKCRMPLQLIRVHKVSARIESPIEDKDASLKQSNEDEVKEEKEKSLSLRAKNATSSASDLKSGSDQRDEGPKIEEEQIVKSEENSQDASIAANSRTEATPRARLKGFRRRFRSGLDFIRKKKKPSTKKNTEEEVKTNRIVKSNKSYVLLGPTLDPATEIRSWVVNKSAGETVLHRAARLGYLEGICYLLSRPETNVSVRDNAMYTPLHEAAAKGHLYVAKVLLMHGADESAAAKGGIRPLHEAVENNQLEMVRLLLSYGADPRLATYAGLTPLALAKSNLEDEEEEEEDEAEGEEGARKEASYGTQEKESKKMVDFLESHLKDVEGKPDLPFSFLGSSTVMDESESGYNVLEACQITPEAETYVVFECSEFVLPQCYQLPSRTGKFVLLEELLHVVAGTRTADSKQCQRLKSKAVSLTRDEWNQVKEVTKIRPVSPVRDPVLMVPYDEEVREVLDVEEVVISSR